MSSRKVKAPEGKVSSFHSPKDCPIKLLIKLKWVLGFKVLRNSK